MHIAVLRMAIRVFREWISQGIGSELGVHMAALTEILLNEGIKVRRVAGELLFCVTDVAAHIKDTNYVRAVKAFTETPDDIGDVLIQRIDYEDTQGRRRPMMFFTEIGLYEYLLQSRREEAKKFRRYVCRLVIAERKRVVDAALLDAKLARDALALEREENAIKLAIVKGFQFRLDVTTFEDYVKWVDSKLEVEQPIIAGGSWSKPELGVLSYYFGTGRYEEGYEDIVRIRADEIEDVAPLVFRVAAADHRKAVERDAKISA
jgi:prophage antirepressor-like protein